jgi:hypothetical protein
MTAQQARQIVNEIRKDMLQNVGLASGASYRIEEYTSPYDIIERHLLRLELADTVTQPTLPGGPLC